MVRIDKRIPVACWLHVHDWGGWGEPFAFGYNAFQRRTCLACGKVAEREVGWAIRGVEYMVTDEPEEAKSS